LSSRLVTWLLTVLSSMTRVAATSAFVSPRAISSSTSRSRALSASTASSGRTGGATEVYSSMRRRVTAGETSACPARAARTAGTSASAIVSLSRNPAAPFCSAAKTYSSRS